MKRTLLFILITLVVLVVGALAIAVMTLSPDPFIARYEENCSTCHGERLEGTATLGPPLLGVDLRHGESIVEISRSIGGGFPERGMPAWSDTLSNTQIKGLAIYIAERRADRVFTDFKTESPLVMPTATITSEVQDFRVELVASGLHPLPFSIAPLPDGRILVTEKTQGLEFNHKTRQLWSTEMGPRGGDELNLLLPGKNYGWPLYSKGLDYDGSPVDYGKNLNIEFELADIEQPVVDLTPAPAVSSFIFYRGNAFPQWQDHAIVGSLKATELYRIVLEDNQLPHLEILLPDFARIRDIETGADGAIYLLLEHASGGQIVRLVPAISK